MDSRRKALKLLALSALGALALVACSPRVAVNAPTDPTVERLVIDTRHPSEFAAGHYPGALNLQWGWSQLGDRVESYVPDKTTPIALRATDEDELEKAGAVLQGLGYRDVTTPPPGQETATLALMTASDLRDLLDSPSAPRVIDIRTPDEFDSGTIETALRVHHDAGPSVLAQALDRHAPIAVICEGGFRSGQLASYLVRNGYTNVVNVIDGMAGWRALD